MLQRYELVFNYQILLRKNLFATCRMIITRVVQSSTIDNKMPHKGFMGRFSLSFMCSS